ncbi:MAG: outer membrane lipoprotein-sorting protein [Nitrospirae bacterium]|nr:outer membrane lipoprotein-sorting protein [Nitrospirota bacterium]
MTVKVKGLMTHYTRKVLATLLAVIPASSLAVAEDAASVVRQSQEAFHYAGTDMKARVKMTLIAKEGQQRLRDFTMLRKDESGGNQRYLLYFHGPADVSGTIFMVYKYPVKDDDRWLFIPALNLVQRVAARDSRSSFVGSDFTYEDVSGRDLEADTHRVLREEPLGRHKAVVVESIPTQEADYARKLAWIDQATFLPLKEEYYDQRGALYKVFTADEIREVQGVPTVTKRSMENVKSGHKTEVVFEMAAYNVGLGDEVFTERALRRPPEKWLK